MRIISWNIRAGGGSRIAPILEQLERWSPDVIGLCEFRATPPSLRLAASLEALGFKHQILTAATASPRRNALLLASRLPLQRHFLRRAPAEPGRWLVATVSGEQPFLIGLMHLPDVGKERRMAFMNAITLMTKHWRRGPAVFLGDTNCGWPGLDEETPVFGLTTAAWLDSLRASGWQDAFRFLRGEERYYTWYSPNAGNGFRLDQAFVNRRLVGRLQSVTYEWGSIQGNARRDALSDHAALILDFANDEDDESRLIVTSASALPHIREKENGPGELAAI